jgi:hypothetical protein
MREFEVTIKNWAGGEHHYTTRAAHSFDAWDAAIVKYGICKVLVLPK